MPQITFLLHDGADIAVAAEPGKSLMQVAMDNMIEGIIAECGGCMSCATCHVHIDPGWTERVGSPSADEAQMLELAVDPDQTSRLSCRVTVDADWEGLVVRVPAAQF